MQNETKDNNDLGIDEFLDSDLNDESTSRLQNILGTLAILLLATGIIAISWYIFDIFTKSKLNIEDAIPTIHADNSPVKEKPSDPGGMVIPNMDKKVYDSIATNIEAEDDEKVLQSPEEPISKDKYLVNENHQPKEEVASKPDASVNNKLAEEDSFKKTSKEETKVKFSEKDFQNKDEKNLIASYRVQLASFKSEKEADNEWGHIRKSYGKLLADYSHLIMKKDLNEKGVFYRLQIGPFKGELEARTLCEKLKESKQPCFVVRP